MSDMQTCQSCGTELPGGAAFCTQCGAPGPGAAAMPQSGLATSQDPTQIVTPQNDPTATWPATPPAAPPPSYPSQPMAPPPAAPQSMAPPPAAPSAMAPPPMAPPPVVPEPPGPPAEPTSLGYAPYAAPTPAATPGSYPPGTVPDVPPAGGGAPSGVGQSAAKPANVLAAALGVIGGAAMVVGAFLPYVKAHSGSTVTTVSGMNATGDAQAALAVGAVAIVLAAALLAKVAPTVLRLLLLGCAVAGLALGGYDLYDISQQLPKSDAIVSSSITQIDVGMGVFVVLGGGVLLVLAALAVRGPKGSASGAVPASAPAFGSAPASPVGPAPASAPPAPPTMPAPPAAPPAPPTMPGDGTGSF